MKIYLALFFVFIFLLAKVDRIFFKANHSFCLHFIDVPLTSSEWKTEDPFPSSLFDQPFFYLGKGAQTFVFESQDKNYVLKFYKFPSCMRRFDWMRHPFGHLFHSKKISKERKYHETRLALAYQSYFLASQSLPQETGVLYVHLQPTSHLKKSAFIRDKLGHLYQISLDNIGFVLQKKGRPFLPLLRTELEQGRIEKAKQMIDSLIELIISRYNKGITDLDNMDHNNYGWSKGQAMHLDIGRFKQSDEINRRQEILRVTSPLADFLEKKSPELFHYYEQKMSAL